MAFIHFGNRRRNRGKINPRVVGVVFLIVGVVWTTVVGIQFAREAGSEDWPKVEGTTTSAKAMHFGGRRSRHAIRVAYEYTVDAKTLTGSKYRLSNNRVTSERADQLARDLAPGTRVWVYHHPDDPTDACLEPGASPNGWIPIAIGGLPLLAGVGLVVLGPRFYGGR